MLLHWPALLALVVSPHTLRVPSATASAPRRGAAALAVLSAEPRQQRLQVPTRRQGATLTPLPALPSLDDGEELLIQSGQCLRWQQPPTQYTPVGFGFCVQELRADPERVYNALVDFGQYDEQISTVRSATRYESEDAEALDEPPNIVRFRFIVSRLRLVMNVRFATDAAQRYIAWRLDKSSWVLEDSTGYWRVVDVADRPGYVRVYFCVAVQLKPLVPRFVVGLISRLGLYKATKWLQGLDESGRFTK
jgi:hypothetical protein